MDNQAPANTGILDVLGVTSPSAQGTSKADEEFGPGLYTLMTVSCKFLLTAYSDFLTKLVTQGSGIRKWQLSGE